jgi:hypothetical protein
MSKEFLAQRCSRVMEEEEEAERKPKGREEPFIPSIGRAARSRMMVPGSGGFGSADQHVFAKETTRRQHASTTRQARRCDSPLTLPGAQNQSDD